MARIHNPAQRARVAVAFFGKSGQAMIPMLAQGGRGLRAAAADMRALGEMTKQETDEAHELEVSQIRLRVAFNRVQEIIGSALAPYAKRAADAMRLWIVNNRAWITTKIHEWVKRGADAISDFWKQIQAIDWAGWKQGLDDTWKRLSDLVTSFGGVNRLLKIFIGLLLVSRVGAFIKVLWDLVVVLYAVGEAVWAALGPWGLLIGAILTASVYVGRHWKTSAHLFRYYLKAMEKELAYFGHYYEQTFKRMGDVINHALDRLGQAFIDTWHRIEDNPLVRMLTGALGLGFGGDITALLRFLNPPTAPGAPGAAGAPAPTGGEGWKGIPYPRPPAGGSVDVKVSFQNAPQGTRVASATDGAGLRVSRNVNYSMPNLRTA
jgi:hypothetical protein